LRPYFTFPTSNFSLRPPLPWPGPSGGLAAESDDLLPGPPRRWPVRGVSSLCFDLRYLAGNDSLCWPACFHGPVIRGHPWPSAASLRCRPWTPLWGSFCAVAICPLALVGRGAVWVPPRLLREVQVENRLSRRCNLTVLG